MAGALDECGRLIDRVREQDLLPGHVMEETTTAIAYEVADHERSSIASRHSRMLAPGAARCGTPLKWLDRCDVATR
jgi:hypothetical protein